MDTIESSASAQPFTPEDDLERASKIVARTNTREVRGIALAEEHFETIAGSYRHGTWTVPACSGNHSYSVRYSRREESCTCPDWQWRNNTCKHVLAVAIVAAKTRVCSGCGRRRSRRDLIELHEDNHDNLTYFHGDKLCRKCARAAGVCY